MVSRCKVWLSGSGGPRGQGKESKGAEERGGTFPQRLGVGRRWLPKAKIYLVCFIKCTQHWFRDAHTHFQMPATWALEFISNRSEPPGSISQTALQRLPYHITLKCESEHITPNSSNPCPRRFPRSQGGCTFGTWRLSSQGTIREQFALQTATLEAKT